MERIGSIEGDGILRVDAARLVDTRVLVQGSSGSGKSWLIRLLIEKVAAKIPVLILDLEGEFVTLRENLDFVVAGEGGEVAVDVRSAALLARKLLELKLSGVVSLYDLDRPHRRAYVRSFLESIMAAPRALWAPRLIVLDEAHEFAPEGGKSESLGAVIDVASRGRKRGYCLVAATQRMSKLDKDIVAECRNVFVGQTTLDVDVKRALDTLGFPADLEHKRELRSLDHQFYAMGPATSADGVVLFKADEVKTTHPESGLRRSLSPPEPSKRIKQALGELADLPKQAEEETKTLADAQRTIAELKRQLSHKLPQVDEKAVERAVNAAVAAERKRCEPFLASAEATMKQQRQQLDQIAALAQKNGVVIKIERPEIINVATPKIVRPPLSPVPPTTSRRAISQDQSPDSGEIKLSRGSLARDVVISLAQHDRALHRNRLAALVGKSPNNGSFNARLNELRRGGLIDSEGGNWQITQAGIEAVGDYEPLPTGDELVEQQLGKLSGLAHDIVATLHAQNRNPIHRNWLAEAVGKEPNNGSFNARLNELRRVGLIQTERGNWKISDDIYDN